MQLCGDLTASYPEAPWPGSRHHYTNTLPHTGQYLNRFIFFTTYAENGTSARVSRAPTSPQGPWCRPPPVALPAFGDRAAVVSWPLPTRDSGIAVRAVFRACIPTNCCLRWLRYEGIALHLPLYGALPNESRLSLWNCHFAYAPLRRRSRSARMSSSNGRLPWLGHCQTGL